MKMCGTCKQEKPFACFYKDRGHLSSRCKVCSRAAARAWNKDNPERYKAKLKTWFEKNADRRKEYAERNKPRRSLFRKMLHERKRLEAIRRYGGVCRCCEESEVKFLSIDHVNDDGASHRRAIGTSGIYYWLEKHGYPAGFQVLCMNCNWGKMMNGGMCPHEVKRVALVQ